jgi:hypothetical protein
MYENVIMQPIKMQIKDYNDNHKTMKEEMAEDIRRWKDILYSWISRISL